MRDYSGSHYIEAWTPRIGQSAAQRYVAYRNSSTWLRVLGLICCPLLAWGITMRDVYALVLGVVVAAAAMYLLLRCRRLYLAAESAAREHLGLSRRRVPLDDGNQFDRWLGRLQWRGLVAVRDSAGS